MEDVQHTVGGASRPQVTGFPGGQRAEAARTSARSQRTNPSSLLTPFCLLVLVAALALVGCGTSSTTPTATARAISAPFTFKVSGTTVVVTIDAAEGAPSTTAQPVRLVCANLAANGFSDRDQARATWPAGKPSTTFTLPRTAAGLDLCAISFTARPGKQAVAFFNQKAKARYLADQGASK